MKISTLTTISPTSVSNVVGQKKKKSNRRHYFRSDSFITYGLLYIVDKNEDMTGF